MTALVFGLTFILAFLIAFYMVPLLRTIALHAGIMDRPDGRLKIHREPVPYLGGIAIYLGFLVSLGLTADFRQEILGILLAGTLILLLGLIDDIGGLSPRVKIVGQLIAVFVLIKSGLWIQIAAFPVWLNIGLTIVGVIVMINALNIIDVMDGLAAGTAVIAALVLGVVGLKSRDPVMTVMALALAGSLLGFLRHNFPPASIFMGDAGSLFLGLMLGALAVGGEYSTVHEVGLIAPVLILGIPIFDTLFVMVIRYRRGVPIYRGSPDHFPLRLRVMGWSARRIVCSTYVVALVLGALGVIIIFIPSHLALIVAGVTVLLMGMIGIGLARIPVRGYGEPARVPEDRTFAPACAPPGRRRVEERL